MATTESTHILYHFPFSICSIMVRYSITLGGEVQDPQHEIRIREESVNIIKGEQLTEHYLCEINANGEVPVLTLPHGTLPESTNITYHLAQYFPSLNPEAHQKDVKRLISVLHEINFFSLTFTGRPQGAQASLALLQEKLNGDISERYRKAINHKIHRLKASKLAGLEEEHVQNAIERTKQLMVEANELLLRSDTGWVLGTSQPTAFDAHFVIFVARLLDVSRGNLVPDAIKEYAGKAMAQTAFKETMQGRRTMPPEYFKIK